MPVILNKYLIEQQKLSDETVSLIEQTNEERIAIEQAMNRAKKKEKLKELFAQWIEIQFKLQSLWGFPLDQKYHRFWECSTKCTCPKMDNDDIYPTGYYVLRSDCPIHGV